MQTDKQTMTIPANIRTFEIKGKPTPRIIRAIRLWLRTREEAIRLWLERNGVRMVQEDHNVVCKAGRKAVSRRLANETTYTGIINYGAVGTGATAPTENDTKLQSESYRVVPAAQSYDDSTCTALVEFIFEAGVHNGTYTKFGNFIDGAAGADTGQIFSHITASSWEVTDLKSIFVSCQYTVS